MRGGRCPCFLGTQENRLRKSSMAPGQTLSVAAGRNGCGTVFVSDAEALARALCDVRRPFHLDDTLTDGNPGESGDTDPAGRYVPAYLPEHLGDPAFRTDHG